MHIIMLCCTCSLYLSDLMMRWERINDDDAYNDECNLEQGIHRYQTPSRCRNAASAIRPTKAKRDVIHKTGSA